MLATYIDDVWALDIGLRMLVTNFSYCNDVPTRHLLHFYTTVVRPVLEYACPVWHPGLTVAHSDLLESVQKRAIRIIHPDANYRTSLIVAGIDTLDERREALTAKFFKRRSRQQLRTAQL